MKKEADVDRRARQQQEARKPQAYVEIYMSYSAYSLQ